MPATTQTYRELAGRILAGPARLGPCRLVAVDGPSGAGKSVFAGRLAAALAGGLPDGSATSAVPLVHTDDLLDGWADQLTFWPRLEQWVLTPLRAGRAGRYRRYSWVRRCFTPGWVTVAPAPVVILEGVSSARAAIAAELTLAVFVTAPDPLRLERVLYRDGAELLPYLDTWRRREEAHWRADRTVARADLIVDGAPTVPHDASAEYVRLG